MTTADQGVLAEPQQPTSRYTYQLRGQPLTDEEQQLLVEKWGSWTLDSPRRGPTTTEDFYADYPNRDIPRANFPSEAWQLDKDYLDQWFPQSLALIQRAQEAILAEYGHNGTEPMEERATMFQVEIMDTWQDETLSDKRSSTKQGGFTTRTSWDGLVRRILHAIMTEDTFVFAMGGHSAAAGHG